MKRTAIALLILAATATLAATYGCASKPPAETPPASSVDGTATEGAAGGARLAVGLYDFPNGSVQAIGTLEWRDIEGGFWAVVGGTEAEGDAGKVVAVLVGIKQEEPTFVDLAGKMVGVYGKRLTGASVRMAGPEIEVISIEEISDGGPAE